MTNNGAAVHSNLSYRGRDANTRRNYHRSPHRSPRPSPRYSPHYSPTPSPTPLARIPKSKSHNANLSRGVGKAPEKRHRSLERNVNPQPNGVHPRETFRYYPCLRSHASNLVLSQCSLVCVAFTRCSCSLFL